MKSERKNSVILQVILLHTFLPQLLARDVSQLITFNSAYFDTAVLTHRGEV